MKAHTKETQAAISPGKALEILMEGNERFLGKKEVSRDLLDQVNDTSKGQYPFASILSCIDSRIPVEKIFDQGIGDLFSTRIAGNFINEDILGSLEFSCKLAGAKVVMVLGHTSCGAVKGACDRAELGNLTQMLKKIEPAVDATKTNDREERNSSNIDFVNRVAAANVHQSIDNLLANSAVLKDMHDNGEIKVVGAMYDVKTGKVALL